MTKTGFLRSDGDGHWYLIPKSYLSDFRKALDILYNNPEDWKKFVDKFDKYRLSGGIEYLEVTIHE